MGFCEWCGSNFRKPCRWLFGLTQIALNIAIICITYYHLTDFEYDYTIFSGGGPSISIANYQCLLGTDSMGRDLCIYGYILCGISLALTLFLMLSVLCRCVCWTYVVIWTDLIGTLAGTVWWLVAALVLTRYNADANKDDSPETHWRNTVCSMSWVLAFLYGLQALTSLCVIGYTVCGCCGGREEAARRKAELEAARKEAADKAVAAKMEAGGGGVPRAAPEPERGTDRGSGCLFGPCLRAAAADATPAPKDDKAASVAVTVQQP